MNELDEIKEVIKSTDKKVITFPRFINDKTLTREQFDAEYQEWIDKALSGELEEGPQC